MKTTDLEGSIAVVEVSGDERRRVLFPHQVKGWEIARAALVIAAEEDAGRDAVESFGRLYQKTAGTTRALPPDVGMPALLKELGAERGSKIVRSIARLALSCETEFPAAATGVIRLARLVSAEQSLTRRQAAVIVACGLLGLFRETNDFMFDFGFLVTSGPPVVPSLRGIVHYLGRVSDAMPPGRLLFRRLVGRQVDWKSMSSLPLVEVECRTGGRIEECLGMLQIDFANRHLGGGVLRGGCAQEEIRFGICSPELIAGMLFCDDMEDSEAIVIEGSEQFSTYDGYGRAVSWAGNFEDRAPKSHDGSLLTTVVAIDALMFPMDSQATPPMIRRELFKAFVGFHNGGRLPGAPIASGKWGCGAFGGDPELKSVIQWVAASAVQRKLILHMFGTQEVVDVVNKIGELCRAKGVSTVAALFAELMAYSKECERAIDARRPLRTFRDHLAEPEARADPRNIPCSIL